MSSNISGGHARVVVQEVDLSTRVPGFEGVYGAMVVPVKRGPVGEAILVTSEQTLLETFTKDETVEVGEDLGLYSALAFLNKSDKLWLLRAIGTDYAYGGVWINKDSEIDPSAAWSLGYEDPTARPPEDVGDRAEIFSLHQSDPGVWSSEIGIKLHVYRGREDILLGDVAGNIDVSDAVAATGDLDGRILITGEPGSAGNITINIVAGGSAGAETAVLVGSIMTVTIEDTVSTEQNLADVLAAHALIATAIPDTGGDPWILGSGDTVDLLGGVDEKEAIVVTQAFETGEPIRFSLVNMISGDALPAGMLNTQTYYTIKVDSTHIQLAESLSEALAGTPVVDITDTGQGTMQLVPLISSSAEGTFLIEVFKKSNTQVPVETWEVTRTPGSKNGYGQNNYIEDMLEGSRYLRAIDNEATLGDPKPQITILYLSGGADGDLVTDSDMITAADQFQNTDKYRVTCFMDSGWATVAYQKHLVNICENRIDCVCFLSTPYSTEASSNFMNEMQDYVANELAAGSSYGAIFTPHVKITDKYNDRKIYVAPDGYAGAALAHTALNYAMWFAIAGFTRGKVNVEGLMRNFTSGQLSELYNNDINPIRFFSGKGIFIWGQKTLLGKPSSLDRLNVRCLLIVIEPAIQEALADFLFELNDPATQKRARLMVEDYMGGVKANRGVNEFKVTCDKTNNKDIDVENHRMNLWLFIKPNETVEYIPFLVAITRQGISLSVAEELV